MYPVVETHICVSALNDNKNNGTGNEIPAGYTVHETIIWPCCPNKMKIWSVAISLLVVVSVVFIINFMEDAHTLGNDYYYLPLYEAIDIGFPGGSVIYKSYQKNVFTDIKIRGEVTAVNYDDNFIIATQQKKENAENYSDKTVNYFIIVKITDDVYGPLSKTEYIQKRKYLGVLKELKFQE